MTRVPTALATLLLAVVASAAAASDADPRRLFPRRADVYVVPPGGLVRLPLPAEVLAACRPDLSDLRLFDRAWREVPYVVDAGPETRGRTDVTARVEPHVLDVRREEHRRADAPSLRQEVYVVAVPAGGAGEGTGWDLVFETDRPRFVRRVDVSAEAAEGTTVDLVDDGSVFRLGPGRERTRLALPPVSGARLTVTIAGEEDAYLDPRLVLEGSRSLPGRDEAAVPLVELDREEGDGRTIIELARPRGLVPDVLRVATTTASFDRRIEVSDAGPGAEPALLGGGDIFRVPALAPVEDREVALAGARGDRLRVTIVDGDSRPLEGLAFEAVVRRPALIFSIDAPDGDAAAATLMFGGGRAYRPRYDLAGLLGTRAEAVLRDGTVQARLGAIGPNPAFDGAPALGFVMRPGGEVDARVYSHRRAIRVEQSPDGLSRISLAPDDVARARPDLADVRVVDGSSRQWPYLLADDASTHWEDLSVERPVRRDRTSRYGLALPVAPVRVDGLLLDAGIPFFDRPFRLLATTAPDPERTLVAGRLTPRLGRPGPVTVSFPPARVSRLELVVEDGDDAPLAFAHVRARLVLPELYLAAPAGDYVLLVGDPKATPPDYELARTRDFVLTLASVPVVTGELKPNPEYSARARLTSGERLQGTLAQALLWAVLVGAVAALAALTLRVARSPVDPS